ncbi:SLC13 family permease [Arthrobacter sp. SD76]|uniref:SLC13 family permease n=1 Tax=Arthrobacter sp. SD76 TaxID=3415007 RepID=UPI003C77A9ED
MSIAVISLLALVVIFVVGTVWPVSLGAAAFAATFLVGAILAGLSGEELMGLFPVNLFVLLGGITYMFAVVQKNGTMALITNAALGLVRGRVAIIPVIFFFIAAFTSGIGAGPAASTAILAPVALGLAITARINPVLMGLMVVHGCHAGSMSSISPIGAIINGAVHAAGLPDSSGPIFVNSLRLTSSSRPGFICCLAAFR